MVKKLIKLKYQPITLREIFQVTAHYKLLLYQIKKSSSSIIKSSVKWKFLLNKVNLSANKTHVFKNILMKNDKINFIKINIFPDGGISRFKIFGKSI